MTARTLRTRPVVIADQLQRDDVYDFIDLGPIIDTPRQRIISRRPARISDDPALMAGLWIGLIFYIALWIVGIITWTVH